MRLGEMAVSPTAPRATNRSGPATLLWRGGLTSQTD